jgi:hypothetical protein
MPRRAKSSAGTRVIVWAFILAVMGLALFGDLLFP